MTDDRSDAASEAGWNELYNQMSSELYPEHKDQAITEFTKDRLQSYYLKNPNVMRPAVDAIQHGKKLQKDGYNSAALIFFVSAVEILLKATLLKPIVKNMRKEYLKDLWIHWEYLVAKYYSYRK